RICRRLFRQAIGEACPFSLSPQPPSTISVIPLISTLGFENSRIVHGFFHFNKINPKSTKLTRQFCNFFESWKSMEARVKCSANFAPLTPLCLLERVANVFRDRSSIIYGRKLKYNWEEIHDSCVKLASTLVHLLISRGDV
ncbi:hypothetical protein HAX54_020552, partial [Datura stramonium]|nr:hypothetical protein [Datura stramonium]